MTMLGPYKVHPALECLPLMEGDELEKLIQDVKHNGLWEPIVLSPDKTILVDGRNRYLACEAAGVDPVYRVLGSHMDDVKLINFIISANMRRRHLTSEPKEG